MNSELLELFLRQGGVATSAQIHDLVGRAAVQKHLRHDEIEKVWPGIYCLGAPNAGIRLRGLDLRCGEAVAVTLGAAAKMYGFDTEDTKDLHVLNPVGSRLRDSPGLVVHRRDGVPLTTFQGRPLSTPEWTAVEVARGMERPRALATLDAALRSGKCDMAGLLRAASQQHSRRNIATLRNLIPLARRGAESPMESEARLAMLEGGLPEPVLQLEIIDRDGRCWRVDFAWPEKWVLVEYDGFDYHSSPADLRRDRQKRAALQELGWCYISVVSDDVRKKAKAMVRKIDLQLQQRAA